MAAIAVNQAPTNSTQALFQTWAGGISAAIEQAGLAKTQLRGFGVTPRISMATNGAAGSPAFTVPVNVQTGDFMLVTVAVPSGTTVTPPGTWTQQRTDVAAGGTGPVRQYVFYRVATSADTFVGTSGSMPTYTFTLSGTANFSAGFAAYVGYGSIDTSGVASSGSNGTTATAGSVSAAGVNELVIQCWAADCTTNTLAAPSAGTQRVNRAAVAAMVSMISDVTQAASGGTGTPTAVLGSTGSWIVQTLVLIPAAFVPTTSTLTTGGSLAGSATYYYRVSATNVQGETVPCAEVSQVVPAGTSTNTVTVNWTQVANATGYKVYGRTTGAELLMATISSPNGGTLTWTDDGSVTPSGALNATDTTVDSGQVNWGAVAAPVGLSAKQGYDIWQLTDSLQATAPVFVRIDYGSNAGAVACPQIWETEGTSTNGSGTITAGVAFPGAVTTVRVMFNAGQWQSVTASNVWVDSDGGTSLMIAGWNQAPGSGNINLAGAVKVIERTRNWDGTANGEGLITLTAFPDTATPAVIQVVMLIANANVYGQPAANTTFPMLASGGLIFVPANTALVGATVYCVPIFTGSTPRLNGPSKHLVGMYPFDFVANVQFTITHYGSTRTFVAVGTGLVGVKNWTSATVGWNGLDPGNGLMAGAFRIA